MKGFGAWSQLRELTSHMGMRVWRMRITKIFKLLVVMGIIRSASDDAMILMILQGKVGKQVSS